MTDLGGMHAYGVALYRRIWYRRYAVLSSDVKACVATSWWLDIEQMLRGFMRAYYMKELAKMIRLIATRTNA